MSATSELRTGIAYSYPRLPRFRHVPERMDNLFGAENSYRLFRLLSIHTERSSAQLLTPRIGLSVNLPFPLQFLQPIGGKTHCVPSERCHFRGFDTQLAGLLRARQRLFGQSADFLGKWDFLGKRDFLGKAPSVLKGPCTYWSLRASATGRTRYWTYPRGFLSDCSLSSCARHSACSRVAKRAISCSVKNTTA